MTEEILDMDRDRKVDAKPVDIQDLLRRIEVLEKQEHQCDCPNRIVDMGKEIKRLDFLDENDEKLRQGINESHRDLETKLNEEHRLRVLDEEKIEEIEAENKTFANQNLKLIVGMGICVGIAIVMGCIVLAGLI